MKRKTFVHRAVGWITALCLAGSVCTASICDLRILSVVSAESGSVEDDVGNSEYTTISTEDGFEFELYSDHAVLAKYSGDATDVVIPYTVSGLPVTSIGDLAFNGCTLLKFVNIPDSARKSIFKNLTSMV